MFNTTQLSIVKNLLRHSRLIAIFFAVALSCICFVEQAYSLKEASKTPKVTQLQNKNSVTIEELEQRLEELMRPIEFRYVSKGKPDPFRPFIKTTVNRAVVKPIKPEKKAEEDFVCATPLECLDIGQLTLVAIVSISDNKRIAMAQDAAGLGYILKIGQRVGFKGGIITQILPDKVIIEELDENIRGEKIKVKRILALHPEEE